MKRKHDSIGKKFIYALFTIALFMNIKLSLNDPYYLFSNDVLAQTSSSSSSSSNDNPSQCKDIPFTGGNGPYNDIICLRNNAKYCEVETHNWMNPRIGLCSPQY